MAKKVLVFLGGGFPKAGVKLGNAFGSICFGNVNKIQENSRITIRAGTAVYGFGETDRIPTRH